MSGASRPVRASRWLQFIGLRLTMDGQTQQLRAIMVELQAREWPVRFVLVDSEEAVRLAFEKAGIPTHTHESTRSWVSLYRSLRSILPSAQDLLCFHVWGTGNLAPLARWIAKTYPVTPLVLDQWDGSELSMISWVWNHCWMHRHAWTSVGNSRLFFESAQHHGLKPQRLRIIHGGIEPLQYPAMALIDRATQRAQHGIRPSSFVVTVHAETAQHWMAILDTMSLLRERSNWNVFLSPNNAPNIQSVLMQGIHAKGLLPYVIWIDGAESMSDLWPVVDLGIWASDSVMIPHAALEAMASAVPLLMIGAGAHQEIVTSSPLALSLRSMDPQRIHTMILRMMDQPSTYKQAQQQALARIHQGFHLRDCVDAHERLYQKLGGIT
jgi:hypothetical protein